MEKKIRVIALLSLVLLGGCVKEGVSPLVIDEYYQSKIKANTICRKYAIEEYGFISPLCKADDWDLDNNYVDCFCEEFVENLCTNWSLTEHTRKCVSYKPKLEHYSTNVESFEVTKIE